MNFGNLARVSFCAGVATLAASCATGNDGSVIEPPAVKWAANGYLSPSPNAEPEIIGLFAERGECEEAVAGWLSRQVVGNPISGECLPIDSY